MPSPFPGMDPYLEGSLWTSVHSQLASVIVRLLNPQIRPRYIALPTRRFVRDLSEGEGLTVEETIPDVAVHRQQPAGPGPVPRTVGVFSPPLRLRAVARTPVPLMTVKIRDVERRRLVAAIEILSPTNKRKEGRREYLRRRDRFLASDAHLLEIDLLRKGRRIPMEDELPPAPYFVFLSRAGQGPVVDVWPIPIEQPLPTVPVPLHEGDDDATLDLQQALTMTYDECGFGDILDYTGPPDRPLAPDQADWVNRRLRAAGLRPQG